VAPPQGSYWKYKGRRVVRISGVLLGRWRIRFRTSIDSLPPVMRQIDDYHSGWRDGTFPWVGFTGWLLRRDAHPAGP
jgi:hypothetical protein